MNEDFSHISARLLAAQVQERRPRGIERDQGIAVVARAIVEHARRRRRIRALALGAAFSAAAAVAMVAGFLGARQATSADGVAAIASAVQVGRVDGNRFEPGQRLASPEGHPSVVEFGGATQVALAERSELDYLQGDATRRFGLLRGSVHLKVGKLAPGQRFLVETPDAEVEVRGTAFDVALAEPGQGCASPRTRVAVDEGVVEVRFHGRSYRILPGQHWPERCDEAAPVAPVASVASPAVASAVVGQTPPAAEPPALPESRPSATRPAKAAEAVAGSAKRQAEPELTPKSESRVASVLSEQNNLYAKAVAARRAGRLAEALATYEQLLDRFPGGALAEAAQGERLRLVIRLRPSSAKTEAARYLARYPSGLASAEARALLDAP